MKQLTLFTRDSEQIIGEEDLAQKLARGKPLRVKIGFDPTAPDLHLGHYLLIRVLADLQQAGHDIYCIIGDFTGMVGDPTDKSATRTALSREQVEVNARTYSEQLFRLLDKNKTKLVYNSQWTDKITALDFVGLAASSTVARMLERDDFKKRFTANKPIFIHEFLYPLLQGYDSVALRADVEFGGTDQTFNLLMGRELQKQHKQEPQVVITLPLLEGLDGVKKMSKSSGNYIAFNDTADDIFGKVMSIDDTLMWRYYALVLRTSNAQLRSMQDAVQKDTNPKEYKVALAEQITALFYPQEQALAAKQEFDARFTKKQAPVDFPEMQVEKTGTPHMLGEVLKQVGFADSNGAAVRLIKQGAVKVNGIKVFDVKHTLEETHTHDLQVGKLKYARIFFT